MSNMFAFRGNKLVLSSETRARMQRDKDEYELYWKNRTKKVGDVEGESKPFSHPFGDYIPTTSFQRLQFRADGLVGRNPNYYVADPCKPDWQEKKKIYDSHNKWRFIIENIFKIPAEKFDEFREMYVIFRTPMLDCKKYFSCLIKGRDHFYSETGQNMSPNLVALYNKKLNYF